MRITVSDPPTASSHRTGGVGTLPLVGEPLLQLAHRRGGQVGEELCEVELRVDLVATAGAGER